jgi:DNA mismatch repair protein MutL
MASIIRVLDEQSANQIAAGEVIENPSSVIKELIENALDAEASEISIEIKAGGRQLIRITDNGIGMSHDDTLLSLERHATSKIRSHEDILNITTMGFRGEAVPSIASISKFTIITSQRGKDGENLEGTMLLSEGGKIYKVCPAARSVGTTIEVKSLFFNVPARRKFQKSPTHDQNEILKVVTQQAIAHPFVRFTLISNHNTLLNTPAPLKPFDGSSTQFLETLKCRVEDVLGSPTTLNSLPLNSEDGSFSLTGLISLPSAARPNRSGQYLFINRRPVVSPFISQVITEAYATTLAGQRFPAFVLHLTLDGDKVDMNVHPQKRTVRLRREQLLRDFLYRSVEEALHTQPLLKETQVPHQEMSPSLPPLTSPSLSSLATNPFPTEPWARDKTLNSEGSFSSANFSMKDVQTREISEEREPQLFDLPQVATAPTTQLIGNIPGYLIVSGQLASLLPMKDSADLCLVDQRRAHSRILFEELQSEAKHVHPFDEVQPFLVPLNLELSKPEASLLEEFLPNLLKLGFEIRELGGQTYLIDALPKPFLEYNEEEVKDVITQMICDLQSSKTSGSLEEEKGRRLSVIASKHATPLRKLFNFQEASHLLQVLLRCKSPYHCPQGKPTAIGLTHEELAKLFNHR